MATARKTARTRTRASTPSVASKDTSKEIQVTIGAVSAQKLAELQQEITRLTNEYNLVVGTLLNERGDLQEHEGLDVTYLGLQVDPPALLLRLKG